MAGHDLVPHLHDDEHVMAEYSTTIPHSSNNGLSDLQYAFSHFQHSVDEKRLVYLGGVENKVVPQINNFYKHFFFTGSEYSLVWYSNHKKQRYWERVTISSSYISSTSFLRGPPSC
ncbi:MAG: hypothetical protein KKE39_10740 [Bacteroidetes bacterium]|nr:hypothetical protein [Bacteroidota bacterium]MBU1373434.1 hypothetical protein [Bacteroidota bacterium]MBU1484163.1 hypothetical protein [Bacteroidota bacterium]MBU1759995.1 hypothetical protein [Bacteroidota bacterium]MBU2266733.1 hypothetical protein [Bacteroidota bacterium]